MAEQADALGSNPGSSKEYEFDSHQGDWLAPPSWVLVDKGGLRQRASDLRIRYGRVRLPSTGLARGFKIREDSSPYRLTLGRGMILYTYG